MSRKKRIKRYFTKNQKTRCESCGRLYDMNDPFEWFIHSNETGGGCILR